MNIRTTNQNPAATQRLTMNGKPVLYRENIRTVLTDPSAAFAEKLLCDGLVMNLGDACVFGCTFCYVEEQMRKIDKAILDGYNAGQRLIDPDHVDLGFQDVVIRRRSAIPVLAGQLVRKDGSSQYPDPDDHRVLYSSTLVDVAGNLELLRETAAACNLIFLNSLQNRTHIENPSIVYENIRSAVGFGNDLNHFSNRIFTGDIQCCSHATRTEVLRYTCSLRVVDICNNDFSPFGRVTLADGPADPARAAGHDCDFICKDALLHLREVRQFL